MNSNCDKEVPAMEHISTIEGFFNRKRGRPPKNRFVKVYKNQQHLPQAIFASFKIERQVKDSKTEKGTAERPIFAKDENGVAPLPKQPLIGIRKVLSGAASTKDPIVRNVSESAVVRSAGTYFPINFEETPVKLSADKSKSKDKPEYSLEEAEDLTVHKIRSTEAAQHSNATKNGDQQMTMIGLTYLLSLRRLFEFYQQQGVILPGLTATPQPPYDSPNGGVKSLLNEITNDGQSSASADASAGQSELHEARDLLPIGYLKFRYNQDCCIDSCSYRNHQTHFHCNRNDCQYSFCDKTRFVQHTARHKRLDTLMGSDFQQYRANMSCGHVNCDLKATHFHCVQCDYLCTDTNKVVAHRRMHSKLAYVHAAGFRKVAVTDDACSLNGITCPYRTKHAHYHCLLCDYSILSRNQLASHQSRHLPQHISANETT